MAEQTAPAKDSAATPAPAQVKEASASKEARPGEAAPPSGDAAPGEQEAPAKKEAAPDENAPLPTKTHLKEGGQLVDHRDGRDVVLRLRGVRTQFGDKIIHDNLDFDVFKGEIVGLVGGSGTGKSVLLRTIIGLNEATKGTIEMLGVDTATLHGKAERQMQGRTGVQFQDGALFSSLSVTENIIVPIREHVGLDEDLMRDIAALKVAMVGLPPDTGEKKPSELSGGMRKRASLARALALDPELLFLDEPTAGLDPIGAAHYDELVKGLSRSLGLTILMVTHDLDSLYAVCDRIAVLLDKRVVVGTMEELLVYDHPWVREYFHGPRGRAAAPHKEQSSV